MKLAASFILYSIGVLVSETTLRFGYGYGIYNKLMLLSSDLDDNRVIWK